MIRLGWFCYYIWNYTVQCVNCEILSRIYSNFHSLNYTKYAFCIIVSTGTALRSRRRVPTDCGSSRRWSQLPACPFIRWMWNSSSSRAINEKRRQSRPFDYRCRMGVHHAPPMGMTPARMSLLTRRRNEMITRTDANVKSFSEIFYYLSGRLLSDLTSFYPTGNGLSSLFGNSLQDVVHNKLDIAPPDRLVTVCAHYCVSVSVNPRDSFVRVL